MHRHAQGRSPAGVGIYAFAWLQKSGDENFAKKQRNASNPGRMGRAVPIPASPDRFCGTLILATGASRRLSAGGVGRHKEICDFPAEGAPIEAIIAC